VIIFRDREVLAMAQSKKSYPVALVDNAREKFFATVLRLVPEARVALVEEAFPAWKQHSKLLPKVVDHRTFGAHEKETSRRAIKPIEMWMSDFHIATPEENWVADIVCDTFIFWEINGGQPSLESLDLKNPMVFYRGRPDPIPSEECAFPSFRPFCGGWVPAGFDEEKARKIINTEFHKHLDQYIARMKKLAEKNDIDTNSKRNPKTSASSPEERMVWLVQRVVLEMSPIQIAKFEKRENANAVRRANLVGKTVAEIAEQIGIRLLPILLGRPRRTGNSE
jgi:hypothetical protein